MPKRFVDVCAIMGLEYQEIVGSDKELKPLPKFSIVIPVYNVGKYIDGCIASVRAQTFKDFQAIVVNDASTDGSGEIARGAAQGDSRVQVVDHKTNMGTHRTRMTGVEYATGDYTFFLDGDDELKPDMLEELSRGIEADPADISQFGITVVSANDLMEEERSEFERFNNRFIPATYGEDILRDIYDPERGFLVNWRFTQRAYRTGLLKQAFAEMTKERLGRSQDGYECFVISAMAHSYRFINHCRGYIYYYGRGISGMSGISPKKYGRYCNDFNADFKATYEYVEKCDVSESRRHILRQCATGFKKRATELLSNDWCVRVREGDKREAAGLMVSVFGSAVTLREIYRFVFDRGQDFLATGTFPAQDDPIYNWIEIAKGLETGANPAAGSDDGSEPREAKDAGGRCRAMRARAFEALNRLSEAKLSRDGYGRSSIRIFVVGNDDAVTPKGSILQPMRVGVNSRGIGRGYAFRDSEGQNISDKNLEYGGLTAQYWAWKNADAQYYGFCNDGSYFDYSGTVSRDDAPHVSLDETSIERYGLNDSAMTEAIQGCDIVTTFAEDLLTDSGSKSTPAMHYGSRKYRYAKDLDEMRRIVCRMNPDYRHDVDAFFAGHVCRRADTFVMRKDLFFAYCSWLFPMLDEFERHTDMSKYSKQGMRAPACLAHYLFSIWVEHQRRIDASLKMKELGIVHCANTALPEPLKPPFDKQANDEQIGSIVPIVFTASQESVPVLVTALFSVMSSAASSRRYDVTVLYKGINAQNREVMAGFFEQFRNLTLRFVKLDDSIAKYSDGVRKRLFSDSDFETYSRLLIPDLLPFYDKVLYLDSDLVAQGDIAELYDTDLGDNLLGAVPDIDTLGRLNFNDGRRLEYASNVLKLDDPYNYFQAGVMLLNCKGLRDAMSVEQCLEKALDAKLPGGVQDLFNAACKGKVTLIDWKWNVLHDCNDLVDDVFSAAPASAWNAYVESRSRPQIIHYAGAVKPWEEPGCDYGYVFWRYARRTPFYEVLLQRIAQVQVMNARKAETSGRSGATSTVKDRLRRFAQPVGSKGGIFSNLPAIGRRHR